MPKAVILTEGGQGSGFGHLTRCLALQRGLVRAGCSARIVVQGDRTAKTLLAGTPHSLAAWRDPAVLPGALRGADICVVDSYLAGPAIYTAVARSVPVPAYLDDIRRMPYPHGVIINGGAHAAAMRYPGAGTAVHLLGLRYALLREEFRRVPAPRRPRSIGAVLITSGGQDHGEILPRILDALAERFPGLIKRVVVGRTFHDLAAIRRAADRNTELVFSPDAAAMKRLMRISDVALCGGGQTVGELARVGVPALVVIVAENQRSAALGWQRLGVIRLVGDWSSPDLGNRTTRELERLSAAPAARWEMVRRGRRAVDGRGADRIARALLTRLGLQRNSDV